MNMNLDMDADMNDMSMDMVMNMNLNMNLNLNTNMNMNLDMNLNTNMNMRIHKKNLLLHSICPLQKQKQLARLVKNKNVNQTHPKAKQKRHSELPRAVVTWV